MKSNKKIVVIIPAYKVEKQISTVINSLPKFIDSIIVIDDACPNHSGKKATETKHSKLVVCYHVKNKGVGGAVVTGFKKALELQADIIVKVDGDGQMNPEYIEKLITPLLNHKADYTKGNRFYDFKALKQMPKIRLIGNSLLSFTIKLASGYWDIMDPTNGFTSISKEALEGLDFDALALGYFFETDMLINLYLNQNVVKDIAIPAKYADEESNLSIRRVLVTFPLKIVKGLFKRLFFRYYVYDFNMASIYFLIAIPLLVFGSVFGIYRWTIGITQGIGNTAGTIMLAALPVILGIQFLLQAISIDINNVPKKN